MYKCDKCGRIVDEPPEVVDFVPYGSTDVPMYSKDYICKCGGEFIEAIECEVCHEIKTVDDGITNRGVCHDCLNGFANEINTLRKLYEDFDEVDELSEYIVKCVLCTSVSKIVWDFIVSETKFASVKDDIQRHIPYFLNGNYEDFAERLKEKGMI